MATAAVPTTLASKLCDDEIAALRRYGAESTLLHAFAQRRAQDFTHRIDFDDFQNRLKKELDDLDSAIGKSTLNGPAVLHAGHGNGFSVRGSLVGPFERMIGLTYRYPGFISTTPSLVVRDRFLKPGMQGGSNPTTLEFRLPPGFNAVDMRQVGACGEDEFLLGRETAFTIIDAGYDGEVLRMVLEP